MENHNKKLGHGLNRPSEKYFEQLPFRIQDRITQEKQTENSGVFSWNWTLRLGTPALVLLIAGLLWLSPWWGANYKVNKMLSEVPTEAMDQYLYDSNWLEQNFDVVSNSYVLQPEDMLQNTNLTQDEVLDYYPESEDFLDYEY